MDTLVLIGGLIYLAALGFWIMRKIDRFISEGGFLPDWDEEEKREVVSKKRTNQDMGNTDSSKIQKTVNNTPLT